jgi:Fe-S-cluster formation regulator IscX/YfhJ
VTVQGTLKDLATAQATHDAYANGVADRVPHHLAFAGALNPANGSVDPTQFISIDTWDSVAALDKFYSDSATTDALAGLFAGDYTVSKWEHPAGFVEWGVVDQAVASVDPLFLFRIRGTFKSDDLSETRSTHNRVVGGDSQQHAIALSDVAHQVNVGLSDPKEVLFIDFWQNPQLAGQFFTDEATISGGAQVFAEPGPQPMIFVPAQTWVQWERHRTTFGRKSLAASGGQRNSSASFS